MAKLTHKKLKQLKITKNALKYKYIYLLLLPSLLYIIIFRIVPLFGLQIAFKDFNYSDGIWGSDFVGLKNFEILFGQLEFWRAFKNTVVIGTMHLVFSFPAAIVLAVLFSEIKHRRFRKFAQLISTFPHFLSWVLVASLAFNLLGNYGILNNIVSLIVGEPISFLSHPTIFRWILIFSYIWKDVGWNSIVFFAAICGVDKNLYEAAELDGANKIQKTWHITLPAIRNITITMFLLQVGNIFTAGFSQVYNLYNATVYESADILETYIYRLTFSSAQNFGVSAAASLFEAILNILLLVIVELICRKLTHESLFSDLFFNSKKN